MTEKTYQYSCLHSPEFGIFLGDHPHMIRAVNGVLTLTDKQNEELQKLWPDRPDIAQNLRKLDISAAEKMAREHLAKQRPQAHQGPRHSQAGVKNDPNVKPIEIETPPQTGDTLAARLKGSRSSILAPNQEQEKVPFHVIETDAVHNEDLLDAPSPELIA